LSEAFAARTASTSRRDRAVAGFAQDWGDAEGR